MQQRRQNAATVSNHSFCFWYGVREQCVFWGDGCSIVYLINLCFTKGWCGTRVTVRITQATIDRRACFCWAQAESKEKIDPVKETVHDWIHWRWDSIRLQEITAAETCGSRSGKYSRQRWCVGKGDSLILINTLIQLLPSIHSLQSCIGSSTHNIYDSSRMCWSEYATLPITVCPCSLLAAHKLALTDERSFHQPTRFTVFLCLYRRSTTAGRIWETSAKLLAANSKGSNYGKLHASALFEDFPAFLIPSYFCRYQQ